MDNVKVTVTISRKDYDDMRAHLDSGRGGRPVVGVIKYVKPKPPTTPEGLCLSCGQWTPNDHPEAHDHAEDCPAHREYKESLQPPDGTDES